MRYLIIVPGGPETESDTIGTEQQLADMQSYQEEMLRAGVYVDGQGLHPTAKGALVSFEDDEWVVTDGPFAEAKEIIAGFSVIDVSSREEALEWVKRWPRSCAPGPGQALELRQMYAPEDFDEQLSPELRERERALREAAARQAAQG
ncbi:YciI family protein [Intrasporangium calvum]|uniref:YCII-related protein n=1 Tax=Intrasporangium calvum (strain ATCC 23552 / DSM 43043 / JCM 3097 / NBRC 12989 / NCIMB 10167 / NRRL B-3866 / 7 KIP) TaxID=710696 RepID=E6S615_INTC7|nr:YciI family protein [Intrasporangium calvum]ADU46755.1 YCII-related protein [Intrasporangium calvum DSM 43043]